MFTTKVLFWITTVVLLTACESNDSITSRVKLPVARSPIGVVMAEPQRSGDPQAGYTALLNQPYITCGIPYKAYKRAVAPPRGSQIIPQREGHNAVLPYDRTYYKKTNGVELVTGNCLTCHAGFFNHKLIIGLGNENLDFTGDMTKRAESIGVYVKGKAETLEWQKWADRMAALAPYTMTDTVGVNPAINLTWALLSHRHRKTLEWSSELLMEPPSNYVLPLSTPPWWGMKKKNAMFYTSAGRGDHARHMILGTALCTDTVEEAKAVDSYAPDIRAYIESMDAPSYPFDIDQELASQGRHTFNANCSRCHGTYGDNWTYPNLVVAVDVVGTDPVLAKSSVNGKDDRFIQWIGDSFYGEISRLAPAPGYIAPPLDGAWATAPYLHNGSVPTIESLLDSSKRPKYWTRSFDSLEYNDRSLGWDFKSLLYGKEGAKNALERKHIYDTSLIGYSNQGHLFGDSLTVKERYQILEYLKTL